MSSRIATKVASAAAVALIVELADLALDKAGLPADRFRLGRKILKSGIGAATAAVIGKMLYDDPEER